MNKPLDLNLNNSSNASLMTMELTGDLCDAYSPLLNLTSTTTKSLGDFTTDQLNFDMLHPVDIVLQDAYDGAVNLVLNDGKNNPRLINSRFSVLDNNTFRIPDHTGYKDTNIYDESTFSLDTSLKSIAKKIPKIEFNGLVNNSGKLSCGSYTFYFKLADADGNETEVLAESGIILIFIGDLDSSKIRMGMKDENTNKSVSFKITNIDKGFDYVHVLYIRTSSADDQIPATTCHKIIHNYEISNESCDILITGNEVITDVSESEVMTDYADIESVNTLEVHQNVLCFGNVNKKYRDWQALRLMSWRIIPKWNLHTKNSVGSITSTYLNCSGYVRNDDAQLCYYNSKNVYYRVGYWPDELYRFGIVYIFNDNSLSPVFNVLGLDFQKLDQDDNDYKNLFWDNSGECYEIDPDESYFKKEYRLNSKGIIKFPKKINTISLTSGGVMTPNPLSIEFDLSYINYKNILSKSAVISKSNPADWECILKYYDIKGFFFVRQKRIPTILAQGVLIGLTEKDYGSIPILLTSNGNYQSESFLDENRFIKSSGTFITTNSSCVKLLAMLIPEAELSEPIYNNLFVGNEFTLDKVYNFTFLDSSSKKHYVNSINSNTDDVKFKSKLLNVPENTKSITNGTDYFSTLAGSAQESWKTSDIAHRWHYTAPLYLTKSTTLIRGLWGAFVGLSPLVSESGLSEAIYGDVYNIKLLDYYINEDTATDLDFLKRFNSGDLYSAICDRTEIVKSIDCFRGDCFLSMFTHRMFRNFIDPELPTNTLIVNPSCWILNYGVRSTAFIINDTHSNLEQDTMGWEIPQTRTADDLRWLVAILTGNIIGGLIMASKEIYKESNSNEINTQNQINQTAKDIGIERDLSELFTWNDAYANEVVSAFEVYVGNSDSKRKDLKKKVNPALLEADSKNVLKNLFRSDNNWELRGIASINRADVNAVALGQWVTFPICASRNLALRDVDFSNVTEQASFSRKRSFYPLSEMNDQNPLRDSNVINGATGITLPRKGYKYLPQSPYYKLEYFTRLYTSIADNTNSFTNEFKFIFEDAYKDYTKIYGSITKLCSLRDTLYIIFKHGIGAIPMTSLLQLAHTYLLFLPNDITVLNDTYGSIWKDSIYNTGSAIYGVDSVAKAIWVISGEGLLILSSKKISKFLIDNINMSEFTQHPYIGHINIKTHYNAYKHDVMFTYYNDEFIYLPTQYISGYDLDDEGYITKDGVRIIEDSKFIKGEKIIPTSDTLDEIYSKLSNKIGKWIKTKTWSVCYNEDVKMFLTFYDWIPIESENIDNIYFSFDRDVIDDLNYTSSAKLPSFYSTPYTNKATYITPYLDKKYVIDKGFTEDINIYSNSGVKYQNKTKYCKLEETSLVKNLLYALSFYLNSNVDLDLIISGLYKTNKLPFDETTYAPANIYGRKITINKYESSDSNWRLVIIYILPTEDFGTNQVSFTLVPQQLNGATIWANYKITEIQFLEVDDKSILSRVDTHPYLRLLTLDSIIPQKAEYYQFRSTIDGMPLWKHGLAGVYDNQGVIKPTNWYGKLHEFNFEFVVNKQSEILKIFNNLKIVSNKTAPYKFEYEVVGESYEWFKYKPIVSWAYSKVGTNNWDDVMDVYKYILTTKYVDIINTYTDFPILFDIQDPNYIITKLPFFNLAKTNKNGTKDEIQYIDKNPGLIDSYEDNTSIATLVTDTQLNEERVHTELLGNDISKYGRIRGNMQYLEDLWDIEIRPIPVYWCYIKYNRLSRPYVYTEEQPKETRHRDKYIKIKVRYTGELLAVIQMIITMFEYSKA